MIAMSERCEHVAQLSHVAPGTRGCEECTALGDAWNELRICLTCGHVGCCEDSQHAHALKHFKATGHPIIASLERGETWGWCYVDRRYFELTEDLLPKRRSGLGALIGRIFGK